MVSSSLFRFKDFLNDLFESGALFTKKQGMTLSAATTFYALTTIVPLLLLLTRLLGFFLGNLTVSKKQVIGYLQEALPELSSNVLDKAESIVSKPLFASKSITYVNLALLFWTSLAFFNSIWSGIYLMSDDDSYRSPWQYLKGMVVIGATIALMLIAMGLPPMLEFAVKLLENNAVTDFLKNFVPGSESVIKIILGKKYGVRFLLRSSALSLFLFWIYFGFLYRWFFSWRISLKESLIASGIFASLLLLGKNVYWIYFNYVRAGLVRNYGDYYTFIVIIMWFYFVMCFFYYGACFCHVQIVNRKETLLDSE